MPTFAADVLPDASGRNLGNNSQRWNAWMQNLGVTGTAQIAPVAGQAINLGGAIDVLTTPVTANANTTATQALGNYTIPAGLLNAAGKVLRVTAAGVYGTQAGQTPSLAITVSIGSLVIFGVSYALAAGQFNHTWRIMFTMVVYTPGSAAIVDCAGTALYQATGSTNSAAALVDTNSGNLSPVDLTIAEPLGFYCGFTTNTSPANTCIQRQLIVEVLN